VTTASQASVRVVAIDERCLDAIREHGESAFPHECCGALIKKNSRIAAVLALENTTDGAATHRFLVGPEEYLRAERYARETGGVLAGFYHSHPNAPARPSRYDLDHAWPNLVYVIVSVRDGVAGDLTVWQLRDDRSAFDQGELG
jgi:proteasome lid subunit RPN8/RPN11